MNNSHPIFLYLKKQNIQVDKSEFQFQLQSHPDFPNLLAIVDTLNFFDISAGAVSSLISSGVQMLGDTGCYYSTSTMSESTFGTRNPELLNAMTIAAGGLSGGLSSWIAGGSFAAGARQGLIVSGLNHLAHETIYGPKYWYKKILKLLPEDIQKQMNATVKYLKANNADFSYRKLALGYEIHIMGGAAGIIGGQVGPVGGKVVFLGGEDAGYLYTYGGTESGVN